MNSAERLLNIEHELNKTEAFGNLDPRLVEDMFWMILRIEKLTEALRKIEIESGLIGGDMVVPKLCRKALEDE